jgi:hypothetical protein
MRTSIDSDLEAGAVDAARRVPWWGRIDLLWWLFVPLCVTLYTLLLPMGPNDLWYHARAGREIVESGVIPRANLFSDSPPWVSPQTPYHFQSWLSEVAFALLLRGGGLSAVVVTRAACNALAWSLLVLAAVRRARRVLEARREAGSEAPGGVAGLMTARAAAGGSLWAMLMGCNNFDTRPQMFSVPLFAAWVLFLFEWPHLSASARRAAVLLIGAGMALWVNTHGAFFTGLLLLALLAVGEGAVFLLSRLNTRGNSRLSALQSVCGAPLGWKAAACATLVGVGAACLNPRSAHIFAYVRALATNTTGQKYIQEWQAPEFSLEEWNSIVFYLAPCALLAMGALALRSYNRKQGPAVLNGAGLRLSELLIGLALLAMALRDKRSILWFAMFFAPLWAAAYSSWRANVTKRSPQVLAEQPTPSRSVQLFNAGLALLLVASAGMALPSAKASFDWPLAFRARFAPTPPGPYPQGFGADPPLLLDRATPVEGAEWLKQNPPRGRLFHDMAFGSYLMWALDGRPRPMADPRVELYPDAFWEDYVALSEGRPDAARVLRQRGFTHALLDRKLQAPLARCLRSSGEWSVVMQKGPAVLLRRRDAS